jgi:hypothetical protein
VPQANSQGQLDELAGFFIQGAVVVAGGGHSLVGSGDCREFV